MSTAPADRPTHDPATGGVLQFIGGAMVVAGALGAMGAVGGGVSGRYVLTVTGLIIVGAWIFHHGKRHAALPAEVVLARDPRPPILYLRSFKDEVADKGAEALVRQGLQGEWMAESASGWGVREQIELAKVMNRIGPYVAVGRPGEPLPELGAYRLYVADAEWQAKVAELLSRARLVVLRAGRTEGLRWELSEIVRRLRPTQLLLILPAGNEDYAAFREWANRVLPRSPLPAAMPKVKALAFDAHWNAIPLEKKGLLEETLAPLFRG